MNQGRLDPNKAASALIAAAEKCTTWGTKRLGRFDAGKDDVFGPLVGIAAIAAGALCFGAVMSSYQAIAGLNQQP